MLEEEKNKNDIKILILFFKVCDLLRYNRLNYLIVVL